jgi:hypothetical protein
MAHAMAIITAEPKKKKLDDVVLLPSFVPQSDEEIVGDIALSDFLKYWKLEKEARYMRFSQPDHYGKLASKLGKGIIAAAIKLGYQKLPVQPNV